MRDEIRIDAAHAIPRHELFIRSTRSGGPGGQHVNTSATRVEVRWHLETSTAFDPDEKARLASRLGTRLSGDGWIRVAASDTRSQRQNRILAEQRLIDLLARALVVRRKRVKTAPTAGAREARLRIKKIRSRRKRDRDRPHEE
ncbi:MAG: aminoacyl-tRNA hydrolase [Gemmatimonadaceae bacterium]|nr:aminoacyl-tRNA hydrolase [Gemmatimonadaceae bacterium]